MVHSFLKKLPKWKPSYLLSGLFLLFIFFVGLASLPSMLSICKSLLTGQLHPSALIRAVDTHYETMLTTGPQLNPLHNKGTYINVNGYMANLLGQTEMNQRIKLKNGHLTTIQEAPPPEEKIREAADKIIRLWQLQTSRGKDFLFVMVPSQISDWEDFLPPGYEDTDNAAADAVLALIAEQGVPCLDLRRSMQEENLSITDAIFVTDHHWTPQTAFWAYGKILRQLETMGILDQVQESYVQPENYTFETHENAFLGSSGKRTGIYYAGMDDAVFILPNYDTNISLSISSYPELSLEGPFDQVCYNQSAPRMPENPDPFLYNCYGYYGWGDHALLQWRNSAAPENKKMMLIGESYGNIPFSLMSLYFTSCDELDMRFFTEDFLTYFHSYDPDTVILQASVLTVIANESPYPNLS